MLLGVATWKCLGKFTHARRLEAHALRKSYSTVLRCVKSAS